MKKEKSEYLYDIYKFSIYMNKECNRDKAIYFTVMLGDMKMNDIDKSSQEFYSKVVNLL